MLFKSKYIPVNEFFPENHIDIHSHLLPGIDDGAKTIEDSIYLISNMYSYGISDIITTPHILGSVWPNTSAIIQEKLEFVQKELLNLGIPVRLRAAAEYMLDEKFQTFLEAKDILLIKDRFILVEMSYLSPPFQLFDQIYEIQQAGYEPILAHPERYGFLHNDFDGYEKLKDHGCLFQLNLLSLTSQYGKGVTKTAHKLLQAGMIDFVGSDLHHKGHLALFKELATKKNQLLVRDIIENNKVFK